MGPHSAAGNKIDKMFRLLLAASLAVSISAMPQMVYIQQSPGVISQVVQPVHKAVVQPQVVTVEEPKEVFKPTTYVAAPQPFFFGMNGMGAIWNNNMGGKADYDGYGHRYYPTYGDYYRTHRYPINDGWMLWDEDLRDKDTRQGRQVRLGQEGRRQMKTKSEEY